VPAKRKAQLAYDVVLEPAEEGGYTAYAPSLPGCVSEGETEEEALDNIKDAISLWLDTWQDVQKGKGSVVRRVVVTR
jgi:predicted RNase H-like HicB family nuclease